MGGRMVDTTPTTADDEGRQTVEIAADFNFTPHSSQRIELAYAYLSPLLDNLRRADKNRCNDLLQQHNHIVVDSVDSSAMSLLDVCNYEQDQEEVDGSGHCIWMGALYFLHVMSLGLALKEIPFLDNNIPEEGPASWCNDEDFFQQKVMAEIGCGTGTAGIGLMKMLLLSCEAKKMLAVADAKDCIPTKLIFLDNDAQAIDLCRKNCDQNFRPSPYAAALLESHLDAAWTEQETPKQDSDVNHTCNIEMDIDVIFATDVLYDLKIIRPFFQTVSRKLSNHKSPNDTIDSCDRTRRKKKLLVLSHVPRWFLPRKENDKDSENHDPVTALSDHVKQEAARCGLSLRHAVRPKDVLAQYHDLLEEKKRLLNTTTTLVDDAFSGSESSKWSESLFLNDLHEMDQAGAVLFIFEAKPAYV